MKTRHKHKKNLKTKAKTRRKIKHRADRYSVPETFWYAQGQYESHGFTGNSMADVAAQCLALISQVHGAWAQYITTSMVGLDVEPNGRSATARYLQVLDVPSNVEGGPWHTESNYSMIIQEQYRGLCDDGSTAQYDLNTNKWWCPISTRVT